MAAPTWPKWTGLHQRYGPLVRYAPNKVAVANPVAIPLIYGVTSRFPKSHFYRGFTAPHQSKILDNIFATRDSAWHKNLKSAIAPMYSLTNLRKIEALVDECTSQFIQCVDEEHGNAIDMGAWLQWYAFDAISNITFARTFGFLDLLDSLEAEIIYNTLIGQAPAWNLWLLANHTLMTFLMRFPVVAAES